jgi:zinc transport system substrate-binding protein
LDLLFYHQRCLKLTFLLLFCLSLYSNLTAEIQDDARSHYVLVSVAPHKFFVEAIAGDTIKAGLLVPAGTSFHTFEPTPKQMLAACSADLWFRIGESFETRVMQVLQSHCPRMQIVDLREGLDLIRDPQHACRECCTSEASADLHIWLSPPLAKIQAERIAKALTELYPEHRQEYQQRLQTLLQELNTLDLHIKTELQPLKNRTIMVSHPAYAYFAKTYGLTQLPIEFEGRDPSPRQLTETLNKARSAKIKTVFIQPQHSSKGARLIAEELNAKVVTLDPYAENYFVMMNEIAKSFAAQEPPVSDLNQHSSD